MGEPKPDRKTRDEEPEPDRRKPEPRERQRQRVADEAEMALVRRELAALAHWE